MGRRNVLLKAAHHVARRRVIAHHDQFICGHPTADAHRLRGLPHHLGEVAPAAEVGHARLVAEGGVAVVLDLIVPVLDALAAVLVGRARRRPAAVQVFAVLVVGAMLEGVWKRRKEKEMKIREKELKMSSLKIGKFFLLTRRGKVVRPLLRPGANLRVEGQRWRAVLRSKFIVLRQKLLLKVGGALAAG